MKSNLLLICLLLVGCAAPSQQDIRPIQAVYAKQLAELKIGMPLEEFRKAFPEAYPQGQKADTTAYEIELKQVILDRRRQVDAALGLYNPQNIIDVQRLWFYFYNNRLAQWGRPQDWPERPDLIIERRIR
ncbi:MAG: hypothetical protein JWM16_2314 [Verrucomicrobiales bacterium]|nr:hypothetical protein [Verrucomicrobiales bacterium]